MQKPQPFVVPAGVLFQITDVGVVIENEGDIVLHTNFGRALTRIVSTAGSITIHAPVEGGTLQAAGDVAVHGDLKAEAVQAGGSVSVAGGAAVGALAAGGSVAVAGDASGANLQAGGDVSVGGAFTGGAVRAGGAVSVTGAAKADTVHAGVIRFAGATVTARGIQGGRAVHIGAAKLQVDAILAPEVHLDPATNGRATIVESHNDLGPNAIKGGFRLADYSEMFGDPSTFLSERGLTPLGPPGAAAAVARPASSEPPAAPEVPPPAAPEDPPPAAPPPVASVRVEAVEEVADVEEIEPEPSGDHGDAVSDATEARAPVSPVLPPVPPALPPEHPLHRQLVEAVGRIAESYADAELPPAVNHLMALIERRGYEQVRAEITTIWSDLLKYHQKKGLRIQHQVTTTFNTINSLVKKM